MGTFPTLFSSHFRQRLRTDVIRNDRRVHVGSGLFVNEPLGVRIENARVDVFRFICMTQI